MTLAAYVKWACLMLFKEDLRNSSTCQHAFTLTGGSTVTVLIPLLISAYSMYFCYALARGGGRWGGKTVGQEGRRGNSGARKRGAGMGVWIWGQGFGGGWTGGRGIKAGTGRYQPILQQCVGLPEARHTFFGDCLHGAPSAPNVPPKPAQ